MRIHVNPPQYRPVTIVMETVDDFDKLYAIIYNMANNKINHQPAIVEAAIDLLTDLQHIDQSEN